MNKREKLYDSIDKAENLAWEIIYTFKSLYDSTYKNELLKNRDYKDLYKGKRCFILGNGPSLSKHKNLGMLANEVVFSVNQFYRSDLFDVVKPNFHVMVDPLFFSLDANNPVENDTLVRMQELKYKKDTRCIFPYTSKSFIEKSKISNDQTIYIHSRYRMHNGYDRDIRMDKNLPLVQNVIHAAIYCAIYMGFKEIYLLGCDMTGILTSYIKEQTELNIEDEHVYEYTNEEKMRMLKVRNDNNNEIMLKSYGVTFGVFRNIYNYCKNRGINIYNATIGGALDNIPRVVYEDILLEESGR